MKKELPKTEVDWSKFPKATQEKLKMQKIHEKIINGFQEEPFKHKVEALSKEEIISNRSNAYQFIDFDKQKTVEEYFLDNIKNVLQFGNDAQAIRFMEKYFESKCELKTKTLEEKLDRIVSKEPSKFLEESDKRMQSKSKLFRYSEEEVVELNLRYLQELGKQQSENGHWISFKNWFELNKKK